MRTQIIDFTRSPGIVITCCTALNNVWLIVHNLIIYTRCSARSCSVG